MSLSHAGKLSRVMRGVNLTALILAAGCVEVARPAPGSLPLAGELAGPFASGDTTSLADHPGYTDLRRGGSIRTLLGRGGLPMPAPDEPTVLDQLTAPVEAAHFDDSLGDRLQDALDAAEDDGRPVDEYGTGVLTLTELVGDDVHEGLCEQPRVVSTVEHEGESWELSLGMAAIENFVGDLSLAMGALPDACAEDLLAAAGDVSAAASCSTEDEAMFFPEGSDCRMCLEGAAGDWAGCLGSGECAASAPVLESYGGDLWNRVEGTLLSCAPDWTVPAYVLAHYDEAGGAPDPFDPTGWGYICAPFWDDGTRSVTYACHGGGDTMRVGVEGLVEGMRRSGDDAPYYRHRGWYSPRVSLEGGVDIRYAWEAYSSLGVVSYPVTPTDTNGDGAVDAGDDYFGYQFGSWGLNPMRLRPDGVDATRLDDTFARDWFAAITVKTATTRDGISILMANHTRCADDAWDDLDGDGTFRCTRTEDPAGGWLGDLPHFRWDPDQGFTYPMPVVTLGSTGLPDPEIPGGIVAWVASSPTLQDPEWDGCTWNNTFVPDRAPLPDAPLDYTGAGSAAADTWRFGGHDDQDIRLLLYTNVTRDFCPDGVAP